jgi:hypothetical protein
MINLIDQTINNIFEYSIRTPKSISSIHKVADALRKTNFFLDNSEANRRLIIKKMIEAKDIFVDETDRITFLDAEEIDEGQCARELQFLLDLQPLKNCYETNIVGRYDGSRYVIKIATYEYVLWDWNESIYKDKMWQLVTSRAIRMINDFLLREKKTDDLVIYDYSGNDTACLVLSYDMINILEQHGFLIRK